MGFEFSNIMIFMLTANLNKWVNIPQITKGVKIIIFMILIKFNDYNFKINYLMAENNILPIVH